jgi:hypothetical protein
MGKSCQIQMLSLVSQILCGHNDPADAPVSLTLDHAQGVLVNGVAGAGS